MRYDLLRACEAGNLDFIFLARARDERTAQGASRNFFHAAMKADTDARR
jgi:hypothetical protein